MAAQLLEALGHERSGLGALTALFRTSVYLREEQLLPVLVTSWMTQARRALAEARLKTSAGRRRMTQEEITSFVTEVGGIMQALNEADPADKAEVYGWLGLTLTYHPSEKRVQAEARPASIMYVRECPRGDLNTYSREISPD